MKYLKVKLLLFCLSLSLGLQAQKTKPSNLISQNDVAFLKAELTQGMMDFVEAVRPAYQRGDTYLQFKLKVINGQLYSTGKTAVPVLPTAGENMLKTAFKYLSKNYSYNQILQDKGGKVITEALLYLKRQEQEGMTAKVAEASLFGSNLLILDNNRYFKANKRRCRWYQVFCHIEHAINWINSIGDDLIDAITTVIMILDLLF